MNQNTNFEPEESLKKKLKAYGVGAPKRKPEAEKRTRDRFMAEVDHLTLEASTPNHIPSGLWASGLMQQKENLAMSFKQRSTMTIIASILMLMVFLFGGGGITAYAASAALPGDALYPVKTGIENARVGITGSPEDQASLFLGMAGKRLAEIQALIAEKRLSQVTETASQFEKDIQKALGAIQKLSEKDSARAAVLSADAARILAGYSNALNAILAAAPKDVQPMIQNALDVSQSVLDDGNTNDDNGNANINDDDSNSNINDDDSNSNVNDDDSNSNINDDDSNSNINDDDSNSNINDDDSNANINDDNSNANINDDNGNTNTNDNTNGNTNDNGGSGGGHGGGNGNSNGNGNDGGGDHGGHGG